MRQWMLACLAMLGASVGLAAGFFPGKAEAGPVCLSSDSDTTSGITCFAIAQDNSLWRVSYNDARATWGPWNSLGGVLQGEINCIGNTRKDCFGRGTDNAIHQRLLLPSENRWFSLGGTLFGSPECVRSTNFECFARGPDNALWRNTGRVGRGWSGWSNLGGIISGDPECVIARLGRVDCMVRNANGALSHIVCERDVPCSPWTNLDGTLHSRLSCVPGPAPTTLPIPRFVPFTCFVLGTDNTLFEKSLTESGWSAWGRVSDRQVVGDPDCVATGGASITCFARNAGNFLISITRTDGAWGGLAPRRQHRPLQLARLSLSRGERPPSLRGAIDRWPPRGHEHSDRYRAGVAGSWRSVVTRVRRRLWEGEHNCTPAHKPQDWRNTEAPSQ